MVLAPNAFARDNARALRAFIAASVEGWRDYIHGDSKGADALIRKDNPEMTQALLDQARESCAPTTSSTGATLPSTASAP